MPIENKTTMINQIIHLSIELNFGSSKTYFELVLVKYRPGQRLASHNKAVVAEWVNLSINY